MAKRTDGKPTEEQRRFRSSVVDLAKETEKAAKKEEADRPEADKPKEK